MILGLHYNNHISLIFNEFNYVSHGVEGLIESLYGNNNELVVTMRLNNMFKFFINSPTL